ncbi:zinc finger CCCH domain-containing protein 22-like isoform X2 [Pistacia vera]|uniref:zinc finger CCCH domain-containing protein 22-like isoform X2 n=1 Tax=Pistacia vera TaxID=55513 RepID=UPI0012636D26|nr:zinc finger CCCH domain-containing protein 22-like isoform X2 [Pistacia vera]
MRFKSANAWEEEDEVVLITCRKNGFGWRPCLYYARGYCKNGSSCRFIHGDSGAMMSSDGAPLVGSPSKIETMDQCHEILRSKSAAQVQQRACQRKE